MDERRDRAGTRRTCRAPPRSGRGPEGDTDRALRQQWPADRRLGERREDSPRRAGITASLKSYVLLWEAAAPARPPHAGERAGFASMKEKSSAPIDGGWSVMTLSRLTSGPADVRANMASRW